jgi:tetratricopeptide (TPR) repeat protein
LGKLVQAHALQGAAGFPKSREYGQRCMQLCRTHFGPEHKATARALAVIAVAYYQAEQDQEAVCWLREWARLQKKLQACDAEAVRIRLYLVRIDLVLGQVAEAEQQAWLALDAVENILRNREFYDDPDDLPMLVAEAVKRNGHQQRLQERLQQFMLRLQPPSPGDDWAWAQGLSLAAGVYWNLGGVMEAGQIAWRAYTLQTGRSDADYLRRAATLHRLGRADLTLARFADAENCLLMARAIRVKLLGAKHYLSASCLADLAQVYLRTARPQEAETALREVSEIAALCGRNAALMACIAHRDLGQMYTGLGRLDEAAPLLDLAEAETRKSSGEHSTLFASCLVCRGQYHAMARRPSEAEACFRQAAALYSELRGKACPAETAPLIGLGDALLMQGKYQEAEKVSRECLQAFDQQPASYDRERHLALQLLVTACVKSGKAEQAIPYCTQACQAQHRWAAQVLPLLTPREQHAYLRRSEKLPLFVALSIALRSRDKPDVAAAAAEWLLNGKAAATEYLAEQMQLARLSDDPNVRQTRDELAEVRGQLANTLFHAENRPSANVLTEHQKLVEREQQLTRKLGLRTRAGRCDANEWTRLDEVRKAIPPNSVLIEIAWFPVIDLEAPGPAGTVKPPRYVAWVIPPAGSRNVQMFDLGEATAIDEAVGKSRYAVMSHRTATANLGAVAAGEQFDRVAGRLAERIYQPLRKAIGDATSLLVSPDGGLWLFPWEALPAGEGRYLVEQKQIQYLATGRSLLAAAPSKVGDDGVIFGDPDYDMQPLDKEPTTLGEWNTFFRQPLGPEDGRARIQMRCVRYPFQGQLLDELLPPLRTYLQREPTVWRDKQALESKFKALHGPRVLVLSTHGSFLSDRECAAGRPTPAAQAASAELSPDPLLRCSLALAGSNQHSKFPDSNDGILTGLEVLGADLRGTELVVLQACESREGLVESGEGMAGLHYAFQLAGARMVLASSWPIGAVGSSRLLEHFFSNLGRGQSVPTALRQSQITAIEQLRKTTGAAHPGDWAFFTVTGAQP